MHFYAQCHVSKDKNSSDKSPIACGSFSSGRVQLHTAPNRPKVDEHFGTRHAFISQGFQRPHLPQVQVVLWSECGAQGLEGNLDGYGKCEVEANCIEGIEKGEREERERGERDRVGKRKKTRQRGQTTGMGEEVRNAASTEGDALHSRLATAFHRTEHVT